MSSGFKSIRSLTSVVERQHLRKYSWLPDVLRIDGSVVTRIIGPVLTVTIFSAIIAVLSEVYHYELNLSNNVVPLLSVVVGLILVFRTSYDRYYEGRKDFGALTSAVRNLSRLIAVHVQVPPVKHESHNFLSVNGQKSPGSTATGPAPSPEALLRADKIRVIRLLLSFVYAVMHHLRNEPGTDYEDLYGVLPEGFEYLDVVPSDTNAALDRYAAYSSIGGGISEQVRSAKKRPQSSSRRPSFQRRMSDSERRDITPDATTPLMSEQQVTVHFNANVANAYLPLPLVLAHEITEMLYEFKKKGYVEVSGPAGFNGLNASVSNMVDQLTALERVATTPIPTSYGIHLKQCVTLYLFALPFTLVQTMHWRTIPMVTLVAFTLMGIEGIADEIEMPFGRDPSDLPLERYCAALRSEVEYTIRKIEQDSTDNDPFA